MRNPAISVIVPVYKAEDFLEECVRSILAQTCSDFELILVEDGSPDRCGEICDRLAEEDNRIVVIHKKNEGVSIARNTGIAHARGAYLAFVDSDDTIDEGFLEAAITGIQDCDLYISGLYMETWGNNKIVNTVRYGNSETKIYPVRSLLEKRDIDYPQICICGPCCKLYRKEIVDAYDVRFPEEISSGEDTCFVLDVLAHCDKVYFSEDCFYHYRRGNEESLFSRFHADTYEITKFVYSKMRDVMISAGCSKRAMDAFEGLYFDNMVGGIYEYYQFSSQTTRQMRLRQIVKVAQDPDVFRTRLRNVQGIKDKIICLLLKCRLYQAVALILEVKYGCRK